MRPFSFVVGDDGKLPPGIRETLQRIIPTLAGKRVTLEIKEHKESSDPQRRYYFAVIVPAVQAMFEDAGTRLDEDEMHEWLKRSEERRVGKECRL